MSSDLATKPHPLPIPATKEEGPFRVLNEYKRNVILKYLKLGHTDQTACDMAQVRVKTFRSAYDLGMKEWEDYEESGCPLTERAQFAQQVRFARAKGDVDFAEKLDKAMDDDPIKGWVGAFTRRERARPDQYGRKSTVNIQQDTQTRIILEPRGGMAWQMGNVEGQRLIEGGDVVDTMLTDEDG